MDLDVSVIISVFALAFSLVGIYYTHRTTRLSVASDRRARTPQLSIRSERVGHGDTSVFYWIRNDGPQDLDGLAVFRPRTTDGIIYPLAIEGQNWAEDEVQLGPLRLAEEAKFQVSRGSGPDHAPGFRVRILATAGKERWQVTGDLGTPQHAPWIY